jgi:hypothetical protein
VSIESLKNSNYQALMQKHILATIEYMFENNQEFGIACETSNVSFQPELPHELKKSLPEITLFMIANYSFETASVDTGYISFEAGFGPDNFGALVHIPLLSVKQLFVEEYPVLINVAPTKEEMVQKEEKIESIDSMAMLLKNPENAKLLKKR